MKKLDCMAEHVYSPIVCRMFKTATADHEAGRLSKAAQTCGQILEIESRHADSLHLLGVIAYQGGMLEIASDLLKKAIVIDDEVADYHSNLGVFLQAQGRLDEAVATYRRALDISPNYAEAHYNLGNVLRVQGRLDEAVERYRRALDISPNYAEAHHNLSASLAAQGRLNEAIVHGERALLANPNLAEAHCNLGNWYLEQGNLSKATERYRNALVINPFYVKAYTNLGFIFRAKGELGKAIDAYGKALSIKKDDAEIHYNLGLVFCDQNQSAKAVMSFEQALALKPDYAAALNNLGLALYSQGKCNEAIVKYKQALTIDSGLAEAHNNLGVTLEDENALDLSIRHYKRALALDTSLTEAHYNLAMAQLRSGDLKLGWSNYEWRWQSNKSPLIKREFPQPQWYGQPLNGARILIHAEQGLGDTIQFLRYVPMIQAVGGTVILEVQERLLRLAAELPGVADTISSGDPLPPFDWHCPLLSLPLAFDTTLETIPAQTPYLIVPKQIQRQTAAFPWPLKGLRVGLAWEGNPTFLNNHARFRSVPFSLLKPLLAQDGISWFSLQVGKAGAQWAEIPDVIIDLSPCVNDMADTAAQICDLDLVITVDTSVAHLAGALGIATWVMLPFAADWRWLQTRRDSPWYPTMRLFRQPKPGDWKSVIDEICDEIGKYPMK